MNADLEHIKNKDAMLLDYYRDGHNYVLKRCWSDLDATSIYSLGYLKAEKFQTKLIYTNTPTYVRFHGWERCDATQYGNYMTSAVLYDYLTSDSSARFISGMTKINFAPIDMKMIMIALPVIAGIIIGMVYFMGGV